MEDAKVAQRLMDDIIDLELECVQRIIKKIESDPEDEDVKHEELILWQKIYKRCMQGRRTGTGITALGDTMAALGIPYGSRKSINLTEKIYQSLKLACYRSSVDMAKELGPFPIWDPSLEEGNPFLDRIKDEDPGLYNDMMTYGRRNIALLTTAPAGSVSILCQTTSGIEPLFQASYTRRKKINPNDKESRVDFIDEMGDKWQEFEVYHPKIQMYMDITGEKDYSNSAYYGSTSADLDWKNRVKLQAAATRHVDHAISSTINLPSYVSMEEVAKIYETAWRAGCKGITVYRDGCRDGIMVNKQKVEEYPTRIPKSNAPKRPKELACDVYHVKVKGEEYIVLVGMYEGDPYEVFAGRNGQLPRSIKKGVIKKVKRGHYTALFERENQIESLIDLETDEEEAMTRMISTNLRHGADISFIVHQLEKTKGELTCFSKSVARTLKKYIPDGTEVTGESCSECGSPLVRECGCKICKNCGYSACS